MSSRTTRESSGVKVTGPRPGSTRQTLGYALTPEELAVFTKRSSTSAQRAPSVRPSASAAPKQGFLARLTGKSGKVAPVNDNYKSPLNAWGEEGGKKKAAPKKKAVKAAPLKTK